MASNDQFKTDSDTPILGWVHLRNGEIQLIVDRENATFFESPFEAMLMIDQKWLKTAFKITLVERKHLI